MTFLRKLRSNQTPFASGYFSDVYKLNNDIAIKVIEDVCYQDVLEEAVLQKIAADAGLAPQVHSVFKDSGAVAIAMNLIDTNRFKPVVKNTPIGYDQIKLCDLPKKDMLIGSKLFSQLILAGVIHGDFHVQNWMTDGRSCVAIDFGYSDTVGQAGYRCLHKAANNIVPALVFFGEHETAWDIVDCDDKSRLKHLLVAAAQKVSDSLSEEM